MVSTAPVSQLEPSTPPGLFTRLEFACCYWMEERWQRPLDLESSKYSPHTHGHSVQLNVGLPFPEWGAYLHPVPWGQGGAMQAGHLPAFCFFPPSSLSSHRLPSGFRRWGICCAYAAVQVLGLGGKGRHSLSLSCHLHLDSTSDEYLSPKLI